MSAKREKKVDLDAVIRRRRAELMIDHIEWTAPLIRIALAKLSDADLNRASQYGEIVSNPFSAYTWRKMLVDGHELNLAERSPAFRASEALFEHRLRDVIAGELPPPEMAIYRCPARSSPRRNGMAAKGTCTATGRMTFDELREHTAICIPAAHAIGADVEDPFHRFTYKNHPTWIWRFAAQGIKIVRDGAGGWISNALYGKAPIAPRPAEQISLLGASA